MYQSIVFCALAALAAGSALVDRAVPDTGSLSFNLTAINARNGRSVLECWTLTQRFETNTQPGTNGALDLPLGDLANVHMSVIPAQFDGGEHNAPAPQLVLFTTGLAHITLPECNDEAWIVGGKHGLIAAVDTADVSARGHITEYPGLTQTIAFQMPMANFSKHNFTILHNGPCTDKEMSGF